MTPGIRTTCPYCGVGCGVIARRRADEGVEILGDPDHPANRGRLCSKGLALGETLGLEDRLLTPRIGSRDAGWDEALDLVARRFASTIAEHGPDSVALYVSGQLLTEDYYVANKLMKGFVGSANIDTNSRLCMSAAVAGHQRAFGEDLVPVDYADLEVADLVVLVGSNLAWCHPVLMQRLLSARSARPGLRLVVVDPRRTSTSDCADLHLPITVGSDVSLFNGLLAWLDANGHRDEAFVSRSTRGIDAALAVARAACADVAATAQACGLAAARVQEFFEAFAGSRRVVTAFSQGVNQSSSGTDKVNSIINCHLLTGRIGQEGMGPFSITGQPNAMGGREVGGLATQLAAHLSLEDAEHRDAVQAYWASPTMATRAGLKAVDLFDAIEAGRVKAIWIMATNPVVSLPDADRVRRALSQCGFVVVSECVARTDTMALAHVALPAAAWGEKDGTVTNSEHCISRQRAFLPAAGDARPDWWIVNQVARRMGFGSAFDHQDPASIFAEHAGLVAVASRLGRRIDLRAVQAAGPDAYETMEPTRWSSRLFADGCFPSTDGRAAFVPTPPRAPYHSPGVEFPLALNTGRTRDQWHGMSRTARAPRLNQHEREPYVDICRADAERAGVDRAHYGRIVSRWGAMTARIRIQEALPEGMVFAPIHWSDVYARDARVGAVVNPVVDAVSGEPEFKHTPVRIEPFDRDWYACLVTRREVELGDVHWSRVQGASSLCYELAGNADSVPGLSWLLAAVGSGADDEYIEYEDASRGIYRAALLRAGRLEACLFRARSATLPVREWLESAFGPEALDAATRMSLLSGAAPQGREDRGPTICACFGVGSLQILRAAREAGCEGVVGVGQATRAGTNCGSCRPEIARLLRQFAGTSGA